MTTAQDGDKFVSLTHRPRSPPGNTTGSHFCYRLSWPQGHSAIGRILCLWNIPMTPAGIEPATFRFVTQHLNHCTTAVPPNRNEYQEYFLGVKAALPPSCAFVTKSGNLNYLEPSGHLGPVMRLICLFFGNFCKSTTWLFCDRKEYVNKFQWYLRGQNRDILGCRGVPQPTAPATPCTRIFPL